METFKTVVIVTVLLVGFVYSQECSQHTDKESCCIDTNCTYCQADDKTTEACLVATQTNDTVCAVNLCEEPTQSTASEAPSTATTTPTEKPTTNGTTTSEGPTSEGPTTPGNQTGTTPPTTPVPGPPPCDGGQHFDAASFIGGMILCGGVIAIIFFGCKFYQSRSERKYQQF